MNLTGITFALIAALMQAVSYIWLKKGMKEFKPSLAYLFDALFGFLIWTPFIFWLGGTFENLRSTLPYALFSAAVAEAFVFYVLQHGKLALTGTLISSYPVFTILFSYFINQESLSSSQLISIALIIIAIIIASLPEKIASKLQSAKLGLPVLAAIGIGVSDSLSKNIIDQFSSYDFILALGIAQLPTSLLFAKLEGQSLSEISKVIKHPYQYRYPLFGSLLMVISMTFFWFAFEAIPASIASPLSATSPVMIALLSPLLLRENITTKDKVVILLGLLGIFGINS